MSKKQYLHTLQSELQLLNERIDRKIMIGRSYKAEARQHRLLVARLRSHRNPGFLDKVSSMFRKKQYA